MNFLSHYYHEIPTSDPYFVAGLMLPDLLSNYSFRNGEVVKLHAWRIKDSDEESQLSLGNGVRQHYFVDSMFHESVFFESNVALIKDMIAKRNFKSFQKRNYALAHVMLELVLDRSLVGRDITICDDLYTMLHLVDDDAFTEFIKANTTATNPASVTSHFQHFRIARFIYEYRNDDRLASILDSINRRLGNPAMGEPEKLLFKSLIHDVENAINAQKFPKFRTDL